MTNNLVEQEIVQLTEDEENHSQEIIQHGSSLAEHTQNNITDDNKIQECSAREEER